ncbi:hypothetical protein V6N11_055839 [Hibiscus sabdariffa]|uniref:GH18 domain-containing protein n=1 Tax=Hibiscus sabdariffa TaxID=183260 RepID=A0ABR2T235_9ROSI
MLPTFIILFLYVFVSLGSHPTRAQTWVQAGYWFSGSEFPTSDMNSTLFTHLICVFANLNSSSYELSISASDEQHFSVFTNIVKLKNPSVSTLLSIGGGSVDPLVMASMASNSSHRKSFIDSTIKMARLYGFHGLDFSWVSADTGSDMTNMATLFEEWRTAIQSETRNASQSQLILTAAVPYSMYSASSTYPIDSLRRNLDWLHVLAFDFHTPTRENFTRGHAVLYDPGSETNTDFGINSWIGGGLPANQLVLGLPFYGYAWTLVNPMDNTIGAPATGPAISSDGAMSYNNIRNYIQRYGADVVYNGTYVMNYCTFEATWIGFDDVEVVRTKVSYAREKKLLGYFVWQTPQDDNWVLSQAAEKAAVASYFDSYLHGCGHDFGRRVDILLVKGKDEEEEDGDSSGLQVAESSKHKANQKAATGDFHNNDPNMMVYSLSDLEVVTCGFSLENKLGEGGYGPVY